MEFPSFSFYSINNELESFHPFLSTSSFSNILAFKTTYTHI